MPQPTHLTPDAYAQHLAGMARAGTSIEGVEAAAAAYGEHVDYATAADLAYSADEWRDAAAHAGRMIARHDERARAAVDPAATHHAVEADAWRRSHREDLAREAEVLAALADVLAAPQADPATQDAQR